MNLTQRVSQTIKRQAIFQDDDRILVAVSGGSDSVALLLVLHQLGYQLQALHCNFQLRGEESDRDEIFVRDLCKRLDIPLHIKHFDTKAYAHEKNVSIEMAARDLRYEWFRVQLEMLNAQAIAVAHHRDDQAETILLNLVRGTGLRGLAGMKYINGSVRRPLLDVGRADILQFLAEAKQDYVTDSTNLEREVVRNRIRLDIIPALAQLNPSISETLSTLASNIQDALPIYEKGLSMQGATNNERNENTQETIGKSQSPYSTSPFNIEQATLTLLHEWTAVCGFNRTQLQNILQAETGRMIESGTHRLLRDRTHFILHDKRIRQSLVPYKMNCIPINELGTMERGNAYLDKSLVKLPLTQRPYNNADRFTPFGMKGSRLVSDYLTDQKLNRFEKENQQVVVDATGHILWIVGRASDNHFRLTPKTKDVIVLTTVP